MRRTRGAKRRQRILEAAGMTAHPKGLVQFRKGFADAEGLNAPEGNTHTAVRARRCRSAGVLKRWHAGREASKNLGSLRGSRSVQRGARKGGKPPKTYAIQVVHGRQFGMGQSKANQWRNVLLPALLPALRTLGDAPARSLTALAQRLGGGGAGTRRHARRPPFAHDGTARRIVCPKTLLNRPHVRAARKQTTR